jgi:formylglycine-generating enzyme required for sulfatase activity
MLKPTICLLVLTFVLFSAAAAQDTPEPEKSSEPNLLAANPEPSQDANDVEAQPNVTQTAPQQRTKSSTPSTEPNVAETTSHEPDRAVKKESFDWIKVGPLIVGVAGFVSAIVMYLKRPQVEKRVETAKKEAGKEFDERVEHRKSQTVEDRFRATLREELGWVKMLGSPDIPTLPVHLLDTFVSLRISETWRTEERFAPTMDGGEREGKRDFTPEEIMKRAFANRRMLLIIGDPGSGKTTLLKYYTICSMSPEHCKWLGFDRPPVPVYFPLRQIHGDGKQIDDPPTNLSQWAKDHTLSIDQEWFSKQLNEKPTLVMLDGLDEISDLELRRRACEWIDNTAEGLGMAKFVVTSRWTGYRKSDRIELGFPHVRADVRDFSPEQQEEFLQKWFCAAFLEESRDDSVSRQEWEDKQKRLGHKRAQVVIDFLREDKNKGVQELAAVPMLLQIIAVIWKQREILPKARAELYQAALKYLLDFRDRRRDLDPVLPADSALRVLRPASLWMQQYLRTDEVEKNKLHVKMQPEIKTIDDKLTAREFCENLRDRAGLIADYVEGAYIFRHKSFREYLAALELVDKTKKDQKRLIEVVKHLGDDWWEEPLRFYISETDAELFDGFMDALFAGDVSKELDQKQQNLLHTMIREAAQVRVDTLVRRLNDGRVGDTKKRYILDCLKVIDREEARRAVSEFAEQEAGSAAGAYAKEIAIAATSDVISVAEEVKAEMVDKTAKSFHNRFEYNAEYILIPGGRYKYQGETDEETSDIHFAKYPLTNKRYRRFIRYLQNKEPNIVQTLPKGRFDEQMKELIPNIEGLGDYLGNKPGDWADKLRSEQDTEKRFNEDDQPVVGIPWFGARAYCCWLSLLEARDWDLSPEELANLYRLPNEVEWEWAASGGERKYPWSDRKPNEKLANYAWNVEATTPVGRYPEGATPDGLADMAGNVWEWMENWYDKDKRARSLRGGSWAVSEDFLRCSSRIFDLPAGRSSSVGFRVDRSQS